MTNGAAIGYAIMAARMLKLDPLYISQLEGNMRHVFDQYSEEEAEEVYRKS